MAGAGRGAVPRPRGGGRHERRGTARRPAHGGHRRAGPAAEEEISEYLAPWRSRRVGRSWMALAGAADSRYTLDLVPALRDSETPKLLVWGEDDGFQGIAYAERFAEEMPHTELVRVPNAGHIPMENDAKAVATALSAFFAPDGA
ncbi:alpha/beta fold hydrolase [Streptomyces cinereoruber]